MKNPFLTIGLILLAGQFSANSQQSTSHVVQPIHEKGAKPLVASTYAGGSLGETHAVIIGISDYQDPSIPDLQFAHRDAEAFAAWLQSPAGGNVPLGNIKVLLNEQATMGKVAVEIWALMTQCVEGDKAIIYFSGHGDVETKTMAQPGYWLCWDSPPYAYMSGGCLNLRDLQDIVTTLSLQNKTRVLVISDACHAGKLAGSEIGGTQVTVQNLARQFANEIKILSCQSNEFSLEGTQWGGGRGCFSFHLTDGLYGLADHNYDGVVNLLELENYLEDRVPAETAPHSQLPFVVGDKLAPLACVDTPTLAQLKVSKSGIQPILEPIEPRGVEDWVLYRADSSIQDLYAAFNAALKRKQLLEPKGASADDYYRRLILEPKMAPFHGLITRNFAAALVDESQQVTNKLLTSDPLIFSDVLSRPFVFDHIHLYIARAIDLLGNDHFLYKHLKAKQYYFEAKTYRPENYPGRSPDSLGIMYVRKMEEGLLIDSLAGYIYLDLALYNAFTIGTYFTFPDAIRYGEKAIALAPSCAVAYFLVGNVYFNLYNPEKAISYLENAIVLDSSFLPSYLFLGLSFGSLGNSQKYKTYLGKYVASVQTMIREDSNAVPVFYYSQLGNALWKLHRFDEAESVLLAALKLSKGQAQNVYFNLLCVYYIQGKWENVIQTAEEIQALFPGQRFADFWAGAAHFNLNNSSKAEKLYQEMSVLDSSSLALFYLGEFYWQTGQFTESKKVYQQILDHHPEPFGPNSQLTLVGRARYVLHGQEAMEQVINQYFEKHPDNDAFDFMNVSLLYALANNEDQVMKWLEKSMSENFNVFWTILVYPELNPLRKTASFGLLLKRYFPEHFKN